MDQNQTSYKLLESVDSPKDIKGFNMDQLRQLCQEIRLYMIECCSVNPGHLGSSLGAVELMSDIRPMPTRSSPVVARSSVRTG